MARPWLLEPHRHQGLSVKTHPTLPPEVGRCRPAQPADTRLGPDPEGIRGPSARIGPDPEGSFGLLARMGPDPEGGGEVVKSLGGCVSPVDLRVSPVPLSPRRWISE